ncbi:MAG: type II toxin-antitoxin system RelE/ParE family toxin [Leptolyngbyaceae cyanobacterium]
MKYQIARAASRDLERILAYLEQYSLDAGERFIREFDNKCRKLVEFPQLGRRYDQVAPGLRGLPLKGHVILYKLVDNSIIIVRVVSGYQDLEAIFSDE